MIKKELVHHLLSQLQLSTNSIHGPAHWARVLENGRKLAKETGACLLVVEYFAVFHDSCRQSDGRDPEHGRRGAELAASLRDSLYQVTDEDFALLEYACIYHDKGYIESDITIQTCWDSDRLDLPRAGITINPKRLCTPAAKDKEMIRWADQRSRQRIILEKIFEEWKLNQRGEAVADA